VQLKSSLPEKLAVDQEKEAEADKFAHDPLIPPRAFGEFVTRGDFSKSTIVRFGNRNGIDPGVVEGR